MMAVSEEGDFLPLLGTVGGEEKKDAALPDP